MADMEFTIEDHSKQVLKEIEQKIYDALDLCGQQAVRNAMIELENDPRRVDTGLLRNSITYAHGGKSPEISNYHSNANHGKTESTIRRGIAGNPVSPQTSGSYAGAAPNDKDTVFIGTNVEYALYVHEGTQKMTANRFLRNAIEKHRSDYEKIIAQVMK